MQKRFFILTALTILISFQFSFAHTFPPLIKINGTHVKVEDIILKDGVYYAPARQLAEALRVITEWEECTQSAHFIKFGNRLIVGDNRIKMYRDDVYQGVDLTVQHFVVNGHIYLPIDYFVNYFGSTVYYDESLQTFKISEPMLNISEEACLIDKADAAEVMWLARIINLEARGNSLYKRVAIGNVVMNRVKSSNFPNTVYDVIKAKGQFPPAYYDNFDTMMPSEASWAAAVHAFNGENVVEDCLYFNLKPFSWKPQSDYYGEIEGDYFYR